MWSQVERGPGPHGKGRFGGHNPQSRCTLQIVARPLQTVEGPIQWYHQQLHITASSPNNMFTAMLPSA